jgi:hypothetical protein
MDRARVMDFRTEIQRREICGMTQNKRGHPSTETHQDERQQLVGNL